MNFLDRYELVLTEDGSPSFRDLASESQETMHHRGGAYSETQLIYGNALRASLDAGAFKALSVGLGLGYNEILMASECIKRAVPPGDAELLSFESEELLRKAFLSWVQGQESSLYEQILNFFEMDSTSVRQWLLEAYQSGSWALEASLDAQALQKNKSKVNCIFYDAFSSKTSPRLWSEEFLNLFFENFSGEKCLVSTYACTGALKRSLKNQGFELLLKEGFKGKRLRTMGLRGFQEDVKVKLLNP